jgi:hypothetical protein
MVRVFVSYRREDSAYIAATINEKLREHFGVESVYFDIDTIPLGVDFRKHISEAVGKCDVFIAIIGDAWTTTEEGKGQRRIDNPVDTVRLEIEAALARNIPVIPVLVGNAHMPATNDLPPAIQDLAFRNAAEVRAGRDLQQHLTFLMTGIEQILRNPDPQPTAPVTRPEVVPNDAAISGGATAAARPIPRQERGELNLRQRRNMCALVLIGFIIVGWLVGALISVVSGSDSAGITVVGITWLAGLALVVRAWKRWPRT